MSTNGNKCTLSSKVLMKLVLQGDEGLVASLVELHVAQDSARHEGSDFHGLVPAIRPVHIVDRHRMFYSHPP